MKGQQRMARNGPIEAEFMDLNTYERFRPLDFLDLSLAVENLDTRDFPGKAVSTGTYISRALSGLSDYFLVQLNLMSIRIVFIAFQIFFKDNHVIVIPKVFEDELSYLLRD